MRASLALDLGSTRVKAGVLDAGGRLVRVEAAPAPALRGSGLVREGNVEEYGAIVRRLLETVARDLPQGAPLGIASQRSTLVIWDAGSGEPLTPMISWQDRRAAAWCERHGDRNDEVVQRTGLVLSGHYAGPKLAALQESDPDLARRLQDGAAAFGTLETWLLWQWTSHRVHETDLTMAARTAMLDIDRGEWSSELLALYGVPAGILPSVRPTADRDIALDIGPRVTATVADQASGALTVLERGAGGVLITLGTGAFVLRSVEPPALRKPGYLTAPILGSDAGADRFVLEGTINGAGAALDHVGGSPVDLPQADPAAGSFCLPDISGLGSPYWRPGIGLSFSPRAEGADGTARRRAVVEGLVFRIREVLDDLFDGGRPRAIVLSGGAAREPAIGHGLAALLEQPVAVLDEPEAGLLGAGRLAGGIDPFSGAATTVVEPGPQGSYLRDKYPRWRAWLHSLLGDGRGV